MKKKRSRRKWVWIFFLLLLLGFIVYLFIPPYIELKRYQAEMARLEERIEELKKENKELRKGIMRLRTDPLYIERLAREKLGLVREGEIIYRIIIEEE